MGKAFAVWKECQRYTSHDTTILHSKFYTQNILRPVPIYSRGFISI